jgi:hypothetical protein
MTKSRRETLEVRVRRCPLCGREHNYDLVVYIVDDLKDNAMAHSVDKTETHDVRVPCPSARKDIIVEVPITLRTEEYVERIDMR